MNDPRAPRQPARLSVSKRPRQFLLSAVWFYTTYLCVLLAFGRAFWTYRRTLRGVWPFHQGDLGGIFDLAFAAVFLTVVLVIAAMLTHHLSLTWASRNWRETMGRIVRSDVAEHAESHGVRYYASIEYEFIVEGTTFVGDTWTFGWSAEPEWESAESATREFPRGRVVQVYFDPSNPRRNSMEQGLPLSVVGPVVGVLVVLGAAAVAHLVVVWPA